MHKIKYYEDSDGSIQTTCPFRIKIETVAGNILRFVGGCYCESCAYHISVNHETLIVECANPKDLRCTEPIKMYWNSTKEKLPPLDRDIIVCNADEESPWTSIRHLGSCDYTIDKSGYLWYHSNDSYNPLKFKDITHWMDAPAPVTNK